MTFSRVLDRCIKILQMCEKSLYYMMNVIWQIDQATYTENVS